MNIIKNLDILSISHFLIYYIIGLYIKDNYTLILFLGISWEVFEYYTVRNKTTRDLLYKFWPIPESYWYDSFEHSLIDILVNMIGYHFGNKSS